MCVCVCGFPGGSTGKEYACNIGDPYICVCVWGGSITESLFCTPKTNTTW